MIYEFVCLRSKKYAFKCGNDSKNNLKSNCKSQSEILNLRKKNCLDASDYQKQCDNYNIRSINHDMYLQRILKSTLTLSDDKRCYGSNIEGTPWKRNLCMNDNVYSFTKNRTGSGYLPSHGSILGDSSHSTNQVDRQFLPEKRRELFDKDFGYVWSEPHTLRQSLNFCRCVQIRFNKREAKKRREKLV